MMKKCVAGLLLMSVAGFASAAPIYQEVVVAADRTDFSKEVMFNKFDDMGGTLELTSVTISFNGMLDGSMGVESLDSAASLIETSVESTLTVGGAIGTLITLSPDAFMNVFNASSFDGSSDFAGTSGTTIEGIGGEVTGSELFTDADVLEFFTGDDSVSLMFNAIASSFATGPGNKSSFFRMLAGGTIGLEYNSTNRVVVNAPASLGVIALGGMIAFGFRRFSK